MRSTQALNILKMQGDEAQMIELLAECPLRLAESEIQMKQPLPRMSFFEVDSQGVLYCIEVEIDNQQRLAS